MHNSGVLPLRRWRSSCPVTEVALFSSSYRAQRFSVLAFAQIGRQLLRYVQLQASAWRQTHGSSSPPGSLPYRRCRQVHLVREQRGLTLHCCIKFFLLLILVAKGLYVQKLLDDMLSPLSNLRNPRWPPLHINDHNSLPVHHRKVICVSIPRF